jgi:hypothetical protein
VKIANLKTQKVKQEQEEDTVAKDKILIKQRSRFFNPIRRVNINYVFKFK